MQMFALVGSYAAQNAIKRSATATAFCNISFYFMHISNNFNDSLPGASCPARRDEPATALRCPAPARLPGMYGNSIALIFARDSNDGMQEAANARSWERSGWAVVVGGA